MVPLVCLETWQFYETSQRLMIETSCPAAGMVAESDQPATGSKADLTCETQPDIAEDTQVNAVPTEQSVPCQRVKKHVCQ